MFSTLKNLHVTAVVITACLFVLRGIWMLRQSAWLQHPVVRIAPHVNDTVLFASALGMAWLIGQYPFVDGWLTAKFVALLAYIALGHVALRRGRNRTVRAIAFAAALLVLGYILSVALCKHPLGCLAA